MPAISFKNDDHQRWKTAENELETPSHEIF